MNWVIGYLKNDNGRKPCIYKIKKAGNCYRLLHYEVKFMN